MTRAAVRVVLPIAAILAVAGFVALGTWQVQRRAWKLELISRVEQRVRAAAVDAPGPAEWPRVDAARDEYRRVRVAGTFLHDRETRVQAATVLGPGYWVLTPLKIAGTGCAVVLVNRGFVPPERRDRRTRAQGDPDGPVTVTGLLRITEPEGGFLRRNDPAADRWHSRDVAAIAKARGLECAAPYFVDAEAAPANDAAPVGGLTVIAFPNNHLAYAITWYALALMTAAAAVRIIRSPVPRAPACGG